MKSCWKPGSGCLRTSVIRVVWFSQAVMFQRGNDEILITLEHNMRIAEHNQIYVFPPFFVLCQWFPLNIPTYRSWSWLTFFEIKCTRLFFSPDAQELHLKWSQDQFVTGWWKKVKGLEEWAGPKRCGNSLICLVGSLADFYIHWIWKKHWTTLFIANVVYYTPPEN